MKKEWVIEPVPVTEISGTLKEVGVGETMGNSGEKLDAKEEEQIERKAGLGYWLTSFFLVAQMAGAGFLAIPKAVSHASWGGAVMIILFCVSVGFSGMRLGRCWVILEERWEDYKKPSRQPYQEIAYRALGIHGRRFVLVSILLTLIGSTIVYIILIAGMINNFVPSLSTCIWCLIVAGTLLPGIWLGSPKDFWQASVLAVVATVVAVLVIDVKLIMDKDIFLEANPTHSLPTLTSFSLGFGTILFSFGGASVFPTIQNDMKNRSDFWKSVILSFAVILLLYFPVGILAFVLIGDYLNDNVLLSVGPSLIVTIAIALQIINLAGTYIITLNPVVQTIEDIIGVPNNFCWQRVLVRSSLMVFELLIAFAVPNFGLILNLIGGSTVSCLSFILPPLMYMKLVDDKSNKTWPERNIPTWERIYLWTILIVGVIGGLSATISAIMAITEPTAFHKSCFMNFLGTST
ncbi:Amino acid transporter ANTL1 [Armadillidium vulgare]|nr:Amino acid transporter ANTL1 [Armadillidium vulgare]